MNPWETGSPKPFLFYYICHKKGNWKIDSWEIRKEKQDGSGKKKRNGEKKLFFHPNSYKFFLEEPVDFQELRCACPGLFFVFPSLLQCPGSVWTASCWSGFSCAVAASGGGDEVVLGPAPGSGGRQDNLVRGMWHCMVWVPLSVLETHVKEMALWGAAILAWWALCIQNSGNLFCFECSQVLFQSVQNVWGVCIVLDMKRSRHSCVCCITCSPQSRFVTLLGQMAKATCVYLIASHQVSLCVVN